MTADTITSSSAADRMVAALLDVEHLFTHDQMKYLMELAAKQSYADGFEAGYRARQAEEEAEYCERIARAESTKGDLARALAKVDARRQADRDAGVPRPGDHPGGPVRPWPADRPDPKFDPRPPWERY